MAGVAATLAGLLLFARSYGARSYGARWHEGSALQFAVADRGDDAVHLLDAGLLILHSIAVTAPVALLRVQDRSGGVLLVASASERRPDGAHALVGVSLTGGSVRLPAAASKEFEGPVELFRDGAGWGVVERVGREDERRIVLGLNLERGLQERLGDGGWWFNRANGWLRSPAGDSEQLAGFEGEGALLALERGALVWAPGHVVRCDRRGWPIAGQGGFRHLSAALALGELQE